MAIYETSSEEETGALAAKLAMEAGPHDIFLLSGDLGAGKSVFARGFVRALCGPYIDVPSPTFTLVQTYDGDKGPVWHFDLYRLQDTEEIFEIGWEDAMAGGIALVEWPQRLGAYVPAGAKSITIETVGPDKRKITIDE